MDIDLVLKCVQIIFYAAASAVAVLTYMKAKDSLLNTVNTEYHKKSIDRLAIVSEELFEEFDEKSEAYWVKDKSKEEFFRSLNEDLRNHEAGVRKYFEETGEPPSLLHTSEMARVTILANKYRSDPFLPGTIRAEIVAFFGGKAGRTPRGLQGC